MRIVQEGNPVNKTRRFGCSRCGCIFDADKGEYEITYYPYLEPMFTCKCPNCDSTCDRSKRVPDEE